MTAVRTRGVNKVFSASKIKDKDKRRSFENRFSFSLTDIVTSLNYMTFG